MVRKRHSQSVSLKRCRIWQTACLPPSDKIMTTMRAITHGCAGLLIAACTASRPATDNFQSALALFNRAKDLPGFTDYVSVFVRSQSVQHLDINSGCYEKNLGQRISLILIVDRSGRITGSYSDSKAAKARCFKAAYKGAQMPIPPFAPFPVQLAMR
jgi:hypothetical protein